MPKKGKKGAKKSDAKLKKLQRQQELAEEQAMRAHLAEAKAADPSYTDLHAKFAALFSTVRLVPPFCRSRHTYRPPHVSSLMRVTHRPCADPGVTPHDALAEGGWAPRRN